MSEANVKYILNENPELDKNCIEVCPNSIEPQDMSVNFEVRNTIRKKYEIPLNKQVLVYGGNLGKPQGIPFILECLESQKKNEDIFFLIVGDGTEFSKIQKYFDQRQISNAKLMQRLPKDDYDRMIASCDIGMVFLDHRFTIHNFPSRIFSYMQAKLPIIACTDPNTDIGKVIVENNIGWWCESNNINVFNEIVGILNNSNFLKMGDNAFRYLNVDYHVEEAYNTIIKSYKNNTKS